KGAKTFSHPFESALTHFVNAPRMRRPWRFAEPQLEVGSAIFTRRRRIMRRSTKVLVLLAAAVALAVASRAEAGLIPTNVSVQPDGANFRWTYAVVVTTDVKVNPGDYFTIYDFGGKVGGPFGVVAGPDATVTPMGWTVSEALSGPTPSGTNPMDD